MEIIVLDFMNGKVFIHEDVEIKDDYEEFLSEECEYNMGNIQYMVVDKVRITRID